MNLPSSLSPSYCIAPQYLVDLCQSVSSVASRQHLRSASRGLLVVPRHRLSSYGWQAFSVADPAIWNWLSDSLRDLAISRDSFKGSLQVVFIFSLLVYITLYIIKLFIVAIAHPMRSTNSLTYLLTYIAFVWRVGWSARRVGEQSKMFQMIGQLVVGAIVCVIVTVTIDAIAHPEVTEMRCNIKCAKSLHYLGRESAQLEVPDTGIPRQVLCSPLCSMREVIRRAVDGRKKSLEPWTFSLLPSIRWQHSISGLAFVSRDWFLHWPTYTMMIFVLYIHPFAR